MGQSAATPLARPRFEREGSSRSTSSGASGRASRRASVDCDSSTEEVPKDKNSRWFHGECEPSSLSVTPYGCLAEAESSFSDNEDESTPPPIGQGERRRSPWVAARPSERRPAVRSKSSAASIRSMPVQNKRARSMRRPRKPTKPTVLKELRCENYLMSDKERRAMESAHGWCPDSHSVNISLLRDKPLTFYRKPVAQSTDAARSRKAYAHGVHVFQVTWPVSQRGTHPLVGEYSIIFFSSSSTSFSCPVCCSGFQLFVISNCKHHDIDKEKKFWFSSTHKNIEPRTQRETCMLILSSHFKAFIFLRIFPLTKDRLHNA